MESFKQIQEKIRRETSRIIEDYSIESRVSVKKCFENNLENLKDTLKTRNISDEKSESSGYHNHKDNAFQTLGFPAKMSYEHRSKLRKMAGKFVRFSYLVDIIHTSSLAGVFQNQLDGFINRLEELQVDGNVKISKVLQDEQKNNIDEK